MERLVIVLFCKGRILSSFLLSSFLHITNSNFQLKRNKTYTALSLRIQLLSPSLGDEWVVDGDDKDLACVLDLGVLHETWDVGVGAAWACGVVLACISSFIFKVSGCFEEMKVGIRALRGGNLRIKFSVMLLLDLVAEVSVRGRHGKFITRHM